MVDEPPIACSLGGTELSDRYRDLASFGRAHLKDRRSEVDGEHLRFHRSPEAERQLRAIIAAEERCCAFLDFDLKVSGDELELRIGAAESGRPVAAELAAAFDRDPEP
jgi:hypothetical protein